MTLQEILTMLPTLLLLGIGVMLAIAMIKGKVGSLSIGKDGLHVKNAEAVQVQSMTLNRILDGLIVDLDGELIDFVLRRNRDIRKPFYRLLGEHHISPHGRRTIYDAIKAPLYEATRRNKFKIMLRPANAESYLDRILGYIKEEYEFLAMEHEYDICPKDNSQCIPFPEWDVLHADTRSILKTQWAEHIRDYVITICEKKIECYQNYQNLYLELGDEVRAQISVGCIEKNQSYIKELRGF